MRSCSTDPVRTATPDRLKVTLRLKTEDTTYKLDPEVDVALVDADDIVVTLPFQPPPGTQVTVASRATGATVVPGGPKACGCDEPDPEDFDTFCESTEEAPVTEVEVEQFHQASFTYFGPAGDADECCGPGCWIICPCGPTGAET